MTGSLKRLTRSNSQSGVKRSSSLIQPAMAKTFEGSSFHSDDYEQSDTAYRKAYNSLKIEDIFVYLECLVEDEMSRKKKLASTEIKAIGGDMVIRTYMESQRLLTKRISKFINVIEAYRSTKKIEEFPELFHQYMIETPITESNNFLTSEKMYAYKQLLSVYINSPFLTTEANTKLEMKATKLFNYFDQYRVDCYSCLTGMEPSDAIIGLLLYNKSNNLFECADTEDLSQSDMQMYNEILSWASSSDSSTKILQDIKKYAAILRGVNKLKSGDIVIVEWQPKKYMFARFSGEYCGERGMIDLWIDSSETELTVRVDHVWPLIGSVTKFIVENLPSRYEKLVKSPLDPVFSRLMKFPTKLINSRLIEFGIDKKFLSRANSNQCSLLDLSTLKKGLQEVKSLIPPPEELLEEVNVFIEKTVSFHLEQLDEEQLFQPTKTAIMKQLKSCDSTTLMTMGLQRSRGVIQSALDQITLQKRELMNGTRKKQLVEWWLRFISSVVVKKLVSEYVLFIIVIIVIIIIFIIIFIII